MPHINHLGTLQVSRNGAFIVANGFEEETGEQLSKGRWTLSELMQTDIREITTSAIADLIANETSMNGEFLGMHPELDVPVTLRLGRYGKYLEVGVQGDKQNKPFTKSLPALTCPLTFENLLPYLVKKYDSFLVVFHEN